MVFALQKTDENIPIGGFMIVSSTARRSRRRALDRRLYLLIKGADGKWDFPQTEWKQGEKMREAAARSLVDRCGTGM